MSNRYRLGRVGRFRINRKLDLGCSRQRDDSASRRSSLARFEYLVLLRKGSDEAYVDDIDNLGNRRLRTIDELGLRRAS